MKYSEKRKSMESIEKISKILCEWDPIGVMEDGDWPSDEYDNYIPSIMLALDNGADEEEIANLLKKIADEYMCLSTLKNKNIEIAKKLIAHWELYAV